MHEIANAEVSLVLGHMYMLRLFVLLCRKSRRINTNLCENEIERSNIEYTVRNTGMYSISINIHPVSLNVHKKPA